MQPVRGAEEEVEERQDSMWHRTQHLRTRQHGHHPQGIARSQGGRPRRRSTRFCSNHLKDNMNARKATSDKTTKLFVLDTNVLMHDPTSLFRFEEHDVYVPMFVLEELDNNKKGMSEVARNARQASRFLDNLVSASEESIDEGVPLDALG